MNKPERMRGRAVMAAALLLALALRVGAEPVVSLDAVWRLAGADSCQLEVNLMIQRASLAWHPQDGGLGAGWRGWLSLERGGRAVLDTVFAGGDWRPAERDLDLVEKLPVQLVLAVAPGGGRLRLRVADTEGGLAVERTLKLPPMPDPGLSDILLGASPPQEAADGPFRRGGWRFLPYADALYGSGLDTLRCLLEISPSLPADSATLALVILGERGNRLESRLPRPLSEFAGLPGDPRRVAFSLPVDHLPSGSYELQAELAWPDGVRSARKAFWVHNPGVAAPVPVAEDDFSEASPEELAREWQAAIVLANHYEEEAWERMGIQERRTFLKEFWGRRDPDPATLVNEQRVVLLSRVEEARRRFPEPGRDGNLSDRARIYMRYGPPDDVETDFSQLASRFQFDLSEAESSTGAGHNDFELWIYDQLEGGAQFVFIDQRGFGTFELAHSTKSGEYYDPGWTRKLFP